MAGPLDKLGRWLGQSEDIGGLAAVQSHNDYNLHKGVVHQGSWVFSGTAAGLSEDALLICHDDWDCHASIMMNSGGDAVFELVAWRNFSLGARQVQEVVGEHRHPHS